LPMNIAELAIRKSTITWTLSILLLVVGYVSFNSLARLEDPEFTIKDAIISTPYPGASAKEVEEEVSDVIERAVQELGQLKRVQSTSTRGMSTVKATIKDQYDKETLPQVWDELRRKVTDYQSRLPPGAGPSIVNDDFGDVYGIYMALTGEGYTMAELYEYAKLLRRELLLVDDVKKVAIWGHSRETVYVEMSRAKMAALGISQQDIFDALQAKNLPADAGRIELGYDFIAIVPTGEFQSEKEFGELLITTRGGEGQLVYLKDVARVRRGYEDPPTQLVRYDGKPAIALGISTVSGGNVVTMGEGLARKFSQLQTQTPLGMELDAISMQSEAVSASIKGFMVNLLEAVAIVFVVLMIFMGIRSGAIIGGILFLTIFGTFIFMQMQGVILERISLGALIIALGMLVDNAIVIIDGMQVRIERGMDRIKAATEVVSQNMIPLLGATVIAVLAFASIGTSDDSTGEYCRSLYTVILISLMLSWVTAVTTTPLLGKIFLKVKPKKEGQSDDPYGGAFYQGYRSVLSNAIRRRWITIGLVAGIFLVSLWGFGFVSNMFFPNSTRPQFFADIWLPQGTHIRDTERELAKAEEYFLGLDGVTHVSTAIGGGDLRFLLTYTPNEASSAFGVMFVDVEDWRTIDDLQLKTQRELEEILPEAIVNVRKFRLGPGEGGQVQLRISGSDGTILREMAATVKEILREEGAKGIRDEWREKVKTVRPLLAEAQARQLGIDRPQLATQLRAAFQGAQTGIYRERDELLPIIARAPDYERDDVDNIRDLQIWSPAAGRNIPMRQVLAGFETVWEDATVFRWNRTTTIRVHADPDGELSSKLMDRVKPRVEKALNVDLAAYTGKNFGDQNPLDDLTASTIKVVDMDQIPLKDMPGYFIAWGGEAEDGSRAQAALATSLPIFFGMMILIVILLFNSIKKTLCIWLTAPLAIIGVTGGLLLFGQPFGFMALLGFLALLGMLIKNAIVLIEEIDRQIETGKNRFEAVVDSGVARMRPVMMAAATTILGMIPLLTDAFFISMAVTIMAGLLVATVLTLIIVPVLYTIFFRIPYGGDEAAEAVRVAPEPVAPAPYEAPAPA
ncbi:MAG: efflux RND transporter permease subunit, partial [Gemmatimonadota bacterium]